MDIPSSRGKNAPSLGYSIRRFRDARVCSSDKLCGAMATWALGQRKCTQMHINPCQFILMPCPAYDESAAARYSDGVTKGVMGPGTVVVGPQSAWMMGQRALGALDGAGGTDTKCPFSVEWMVLPSVSVSVLVTIFAPIFALVLALPLDTDLEIVTLFGTRSTVTNPSPLAFYLHVVASIKRVSITSLLSSRSVTSAIILTVPHSTQFPPTAELSPLQTSPGTQTLYKLPHYFVQSVN
jgi:hypothetical protein